MHHPPWHSISKQTKQTQTTNIYFSVWRMVLKLGGCPHIFLHQYIKNIIQYEVLF